MPGYHLNITFKTRVLNLFRRCFLLHGPEKWLAARSQGKAPGSFLAKLIPPNYLYPRKSMRTVLRDGIRYELDLGDVVDHYIYFGLHETARQQLYGLVHEGMHILDIGANIGDTSLHFAKMVGASGAIYAFEPDESNYARAQKNIGLNPFGTIKLVRCALGSASGTSKLFRVNEGNRGMNRLLDKDSDLPYTEITVTTLDSFVRDEQVERIDLIKIDVEGYEANVLKGGLATLKKFRPVLFIELDDDNLQANHESAAGLVGLLNEMGYRVNRADTGQALGPGTDYTHCHYDIIART